MMTNTILTQETINKASYKELQVFAKANGMQSSGKGITAEFLRNQLLNLIATEEHTEEPISDNSIPVGDLEQTRDNAPAEDDKKEDETPAKSTSKTIRIPVLVQSKDGSSKWESEETKRFTYSPMETSEALMVAKLILEGDDKYKNGATFKYKSSADENIKDKDFVEGYKLIAILKRVFDTQFVDKYIMYLRQTRWIALANMKGVNKYIVGQAMRNGLEKGREQGIEPTCRTRVKPQDNTESTEAAAE
jgi:hypothetical protein